MNICTWEINVSTSRCCHINLKDEYQHLEDECHHLEDEYKHLEHEYKHLEDEPSVSGMKPSPGR